MSSKMNILLTQVTFQSLVTIRRHLFDKIFISSQVIANLKTCHGNMAYILYFKKIVGVTGIGRLEMEV